jgi:vacuolar-type H+-ATPase subunit I/STV1
VTIIVAGLTTGILAALAQILFNVYPPYAYGVCVACHARDLVNWLVNAGTGSTLAVAGVSVAAPVLTVVGLIVGAYIASAKNREFKFKTTKHPIKMFIYGFLVMVFALILGACPLRTILRVAYGDIIAVIGFIAIAAGVILSAGIIKWSAQRGLKTKEGL